MTETNESRGQTNQDYLLGVSIMLVTVFFVLGYTPTVFSSYESPVDAVDRAQVERAAEYLVSNFSVENRSNHLKFDATGDPAVTGIYDSLSSEEGFENFRVGANLNTSTTTRARPNINVTVVPSSELNESDALAPISWDRDGDGEDETLGFGQRYPVNSGEPAASTTRVVTLDNDTSTNFCNPTCWLVVRVW